MTLLQPSYLIGLLALAIPIAIHLWNRKKLRTIKVGSTQFIEASKSKQSNSIQLNEWWLLALRSLIFGLLVVILTEPHISKTPKQKDIAYVFEPSLLATEEGRARFSQVPQDGRRLLISGFPEWEEGDEVLDAQTPNYWQLARQMEKIPADSIVVFTHAFAKAIKGKRPRVKANIHWIPVDVENTVSEPVVAVMKEDSLDVLTVHSEATRLAFTKSKISNGKVSYNNTKDSVTIESASGLRSLPIQRQQPIQVAIVYTKKEDAQRVFMEAAFRAIGKYTERDIQLKLMDDVSNTTLEESDYLVALSNQFVASSGIPTLLYRPDSLAKELIEEGNKATVSFLTRKLTPQIVVEEGLAQQILQWLELDKEIEETIEVLDRRTVSRSQLETAVSIETTAIDKLIVADMSYGLWIVLLILLTGERLIARIRKQ